MRIAPTPQKRLGLDERYRSDRNPWTRGVKLAQILATMLVLAPCGPGFVGYAQAGGGGGGPGCPDTSYTYDCAGRLSCVYDDCTGAGVIYTYDSDGNILSITTATTSCQQNTCSIITNKDFASSQKVPALTTRPAAHGNPTVARTARAIGDKLKNLGATAHTKHQPEDKRLAVAVR
jgi:hypothetical protein